jgi:hypothetical protein
VERKKINKERRGSRRKARRVKEERKKENCVDIIRLKSKISVSIFLH